MSPKRAARARRPVALVTGAAVRVGRALAESLAARGFDLVLHVGSKRTEAERLARRLEKAHGTLSLVVVADLGSREGVQALFAAIDGFRPQLDVVINSAARFEKVPFLELSDDALDAMLAVNLAGPMRLAREGARRMRKGGRIVNLLDIGGAVQAWRGFAHYCAAKAGLTMLTRVLALELAPHIRVDGIAPGTVLAPEQYPPEVLGRLKQAIPLERFGDPSDVVRALGYLLDSPFVTGTVMVVDGGRSQGAGGGNEVA